jgi:hypothetical protein
VNEIEQKRKSRHLSRKKCLWRRDRTIFYPISSKRRNFPTVRLQSIRYLENVAKIWIFLLPRKLLNTFFNRFVFSSRSLAKKYMMTMAKTKTKIWVSYKNIVFLKIVFLNLLCRCYLLKWCTGCIDSTEKLTRRTLSKKDIGKILAKSDSIQF